MKVMGQEFADLMQKLTDEAQEREMRIAALTAENERLRAALFEISNNEYSGYGGIGGIAQAALYPVVQQLTPETKA